MHRSTLLALCALLLGAAVLAGCGGGDESAATTEAAGSAQEQGAAETAVALDGTVGPDFTIGLASGGQPVTELAAGTYTITVDDQASSHNFHLRGPGLDEMTSVSETGTVTWTVDLQPGEYTFVCDPHASGMKGSFTVD